jgi:nitroreductase
MPRSNHNVGETVLPQSDYERGDSGREEARVKALEVTIFSCHNIIKNREAEIFMARHLELFEVIERRRSIRAFGSKPVKEGDLKRILSAAILAPSAGDVQPWEFIVTTDAEVKRDLALAALGQSWMEEAPVIITVCAREDASASRYGERGRKFYCIQDTAAAVQNILLASTALGYGSCWVGAFDEEEVRKVLRTPKGIRPVAIVPVGIPGEVPEVRSKRDLKRVLHFEVYGE